MKSKTVEVGIEYRITLTPDEADALIDIANAVQVDGKGHFHEDDHPGYDALMVLRDHLTTPQSREHG